jgi:hypothetical protein
MDNSFYLAIFFTAITIFIVAIFLFFLPEITTRQREIYLAHCKIYLLEYYQGLASNSGIDIIFCAKCGDGCIAVDIEIKIGYEVRHVEITLKVNDLDAGDIYVAKIDDKQIIEFKNLDLRQY